MKSKDEIEKRLRHLRVRYTTQYVSKSQERRHTNCVHNHEHVPRGRYSKTVASDVAIAPRKHMTLMVVQPESPVRLCMYGSENPSTWPGNICDHDDTARQCPWFKALKDADGARAEYEEKLADDKWVLENHQDVATLQWVLGDGARAHKMKLSWLERLLLWLHVRKAKVPPALPAPPQVDLPDDLWEDK